MLFLCRFFFLLINPSKFLHFKLIKENGAWRLSILFLFLNRKNLSYTFIDFLRHIYIFFLNRRPSFFIWKFLKLWHSHKLIFGPCFLLLIWLKMIQSRNNSTKKEKTNLLNCYFFLYLICSLFLQENNIIRDAFRTTLLHTICDALCTLKRTWDSFRGVLSDKFHETFRDALLDVFRDNSDIQTNCFLTVVFCC